MNLAMVIAVYASISKELGIPLRFPGKPGAYHSLLEMTDADLLAKATVWAATDERCANQAFNITNGDLFRWNELWPKIALYFEMETAPPLQMNLETVMADKSRFGIAWSRSMGLQSTIMRRFHPGSSVISCSPGIMISLQTARRPAASDFMSMSIRRPCS